MASIRCGIVGLLLVASCPARARTHDATIAPTGRWTGPTGAAATMPAMGWSSWNAFRTEITEDKVLGSADALLRTGLAARGYRYVNIDDGWWLRRRERDGRLEVRTAIFPSAAAPEGGDTSLRPLVDRIHAMGLKAGIYTDIGRNACSQAYDLESPNLPIGTTREREVGLYDHVDQDIRLFFRDWRFDYVKIDGCGMADFGADRPYVAKLNYRPMPPAIVRGQPALGDIARIRDLYESVATVIKRTVPAGDATLSICTWGQADVRRWGKDVGSSWRTGEDITPDWSSILQSFDTAAGRALYAHPGAWNDPDMLFIGSGDFDEHHLTEARSHFSLWAMIAAPLIIGYDLRKAPKALLDVWGNRDVIAIDQDPAGNQGVIAYRSSDMQIIVKTLADGRKAVALFNRTNAPVVATLTADHVKLAHDAPIGLTDLWDHAGSRSFTGQIEIRLAAHETRLFVADGKRRLPDGFYLSELPGIVNVADDGVRQPELDPTIHRGISSWASSRSGGEYPAYSGWGGAQADATPYGTALSVAGRSFAAGIGILSRSRIEVRSAGRFNRFSTEVGVDDTTRDRKTAVTFAVYGDGRLLVRSAPLAFGQKPQKLSANIVGVKVVELIAFSETSAETAWGDATLYLR